MQIHRSLGVSRLVICLLAGLFGGYGAEAAEQIAEQVISSDSDPIKLTYADGRFLVAEEKMGVQKLIANLSEIRFAQNQKLLVIVNSKDALVEADIALLSDYLADRGIAHEFRLRQPNGLSLLPYAYVLGIGIVVLLLGKLLRGRDGGAPG